MQQSGERTIRRGVHGRLYKDPDGRGQRMENRAGGQGGRAKSLNEILLIVIVIDINKSISHTYLFMLAHKHQHCKRRTA